MPTNKNTRRSSQRKTGNRKKKSNQAQISVKEASLSNIDDKYVKSKKNFVYDKMKLKRNLVYEKKEL